MSWALGGSYGGATSSPKAPVQADEQPVPLIETKPADECVQHGHRPNRSVICATSQSKPSGHASRVRSRTRLWRLMS